MVSESFANLVRFSDAYPVANSSYSYGYVANSNLLASVTSPVHSTTYGYEGNRDLKTLVQNGGYSTYAYRYDAIGRRSSRVQSGTAFAQSSFDAFGYNTRSEVIASDRYLGTDPTDTSQSVVADTFAYNFDPIGDWCCCGHFGGYFFF